MDVPYAQPVPDPSSRPNPYAEASTEAPLPIQNLVAIEGETVICRQDFDIRRFCYFTGEKQSAYAGELFRSAPVLPDWWFPGHQFLLVVWAVLVILLAWFLDMRLAGLVACARLLELPLITAFLWISKKSPLKLRIRAASSASIFQRLRVVGWSGTAFMLSFPVAFANMCLACWFFTGRQVFSPGIHAQSIAYCVLILLGAVSEFYLARNGMVRCTASGDLYRIDGFPAPLVAALQSHLANRTSFE